MAIRSQRLIQDSYKELPKPLSLTPLFPHHSGFCRQGGCKLVLQGQALHRQGTGRNPRPLRVIIIEDRSDQAAGLLNNVVLYCSLTND